MKIRKLLACLMIGLTLASCQSKDNENKPSTATTINTQTENENQKRETVIYDYMDTVTSFVAYTDTEEEFEKYKQLLTEDLKKFHQFYNTYKDFDGVNNVKTINENAGTKPVEVDPEIIELIEFGFQMYDLTDGKINIALGNLLSLWHNYREEALNNPKDARVPSKEELEEAASHSNIEAVEIDKENNTVYISDPDVKLDIGAIAKGLAIKKIESHLIEAGLKHGILSVGGDDVLIGPNPTKEAGKWKIAIQNPALTSDNPYSSIINLRDTTVVTSGDYQRFYKVGDEIYHHIIDPETNMPSRYFRSVSVVHKDIAIADTLSTYLFVVDLEKGMEIAKEFDAEVLWIDKEDNYYKTDGWESFEDKSDK